MRLPVILAFAALFVSSINAEAYNYETHYSNNNLRWLQTQLNISPGISGAIRPVMCTGEQMTLNPSVTPAPLWYPTSFDGGTASTATAWTDIDGPFSNSPGGTPNRPIAWVSDARFAQIISHQSSGGPTYDYFTDRPDWDAFWNGAAQEEMERMHYFTALNNYWYPPDNPSNNYAPASVGIYCKATANLILSYPPYTIPLSPAGGYIGDPLPSQSLTLPNSPGTVSFRTDIDVAGCAASIFTRVHSPATATGFIFDTPAFSHNFQGNQLQVQVESPISCQNLAVVSHTVPGTVQANTVFPFTFTLQNPMGREIRIPVGGISLAAGSQFSLLTFPPGQLPRTIPAGGQSTLTATVRAPASSGTYPFQLQLSYSTTQPDCTGNTADCSQPFLTIVNVVVPPPGNPPVSCSLFPPSTAIDPGGSRTFTATCRDSANQSAECPGFDWSENVQGASLQFPSTPPAPNPTNTLNVQPAAPQQAGREVRATYNSEGFPVFSCTSVVGINAPPPRPNLVCNMSISGDGTPEVGEPVTVSITTRNIGNQNAIPLNPPIVTRLREFDSEPPNPLERDFTYNSLPPGGSITHQATYNCELAGHVSYAGIADWTSQVDEGFSESDNTCSLAFDCTSPNLEPVACWIEPASLTVQIGGPSHLAWVFCNASSGAPAPCNPLTNWDVQPGAIATVSPSQGLQTSVTGVLIGSGALRARYPASQPYDYECSVPLQVQSGGFSFPDLVVTAIPVSNPNPMENETVSIWVTVQNVDSAAAGASQTGLLVDSYREPNLPTPMLLPNHSVTLGPWQHTCQNPNNSTTLVGIADARNNVDEDGNEGNNRLSRTINCTLDIPIDEPLLPDYVGGIAFDPPAPGAGESVRITVTTRNAGSGAQFDSTTNLTIDGIPIVDFFIPALGIGEFRDSTYDYACPLSGGPHMVAATVDANDDVEEANEGNNLVTAVLYCLPETELFCYDYI